MRSNEPPSNLRGEPTIFQKYKKTRLSPENAQQYASGPSSQYYDNRQTGQPQDGEKGLMATVIGGGAGGALGHKMSHGSKFKTLLGGAAGAALANAVEHKIKGKKKPMASHGHHHAPPPPHHPNHSHHGHGGSFGGLLPAAGSQHGGSMSSLGGLFGGQKHQGPPSHHSSHHGHHGHHKW
ncbi:hypothetical protein KVR01_003933 [Diaporthe batatas]|uniref:uncharacterized protein n=1 Tax=Diaporthe batatas TaxID=748121 RepID=UPI001D05C02B|nr:uncharacterized protein KVR01_003933 [Diaporthe batatas]KAG8168244.1 hypothetical protein KVR01_003933 [Diaporthe batatas]